MSKDRTDDNLVFIMVSMSLSRNTRYLSVSGHLHHSSPAISAAMPIGDRGAPAPSEQTPVGKIQYIRLCSFDRLTLI